MHKLLLSISALLAFSGAAQAQADFRPGYIVPLSGDTLRGQVDYRGAQRSARLARFRSAAESSTTEYTPMQLRGYGFANGKSYQVETITLPTSAAEPFFVEVIVQGPASLLYLRDKDDAEHLFLRKGTQPAQELIQRTEETYVNGTRYQKTINEFQRTLAAGMQDCPVVQPSLSKLRYGTNSIAAVVRQYNTCLGGRSAVTPTNSTDRKSSFQLGLVLGAEKSKLLLNNTETEREVSSNALPTFGLSAHLKLARLNPHLAIRVEALYTPTASYTGEYDYKSSDGYTMHQQLEVKLSSIRVPVLVRYTLPGKRVQPFVQVGFSGNVLLETDNRERSRFVDRQSFPDYYAWRPIVEQPRKFEQGLLGGLGLNLAQASGRNISAEVRYERTNGFSDNIGTTTKVNRYSLLIGYSLTK